MHYHDTALVTVLSLLLYWVLTALVGRARGRYGISAPAISGNADFERVFRVQQNTLESLIMHLPALWLFAVYVSDPWAAALGALWIVGRILYARGYIAEAKKRGPGMLVSIFSTTVLLVGALIAVSGALLKSLS
ncbi:MAG: MAPEG family protein [Nevskiaceae bacterium]|nr:MAG: MAPEG family protein [Nevskiaceae bacterium]